MSLNSLSKKLTIGALSLDLMPLTARRQRWGGHSAPPSIKNFKCQKTAFLRPPKLRKFLEHLFGQILVKNFFGHMTPLGPPDPSKKGVIFQK